MSDYRQKLIAAFRKSTNECFDDEIYERFLNSEPLTLSMFFMNQKFQSKSIKEVYQILSSINVKKIQDLLDLKVENSFFSENWARFGEFIEEVKNDYRECETNTEVYKDSVRQFYKLNEEKIIKHVIAKSDKGEIFMQRDYLQSLRITQIRSEIKNIIKQEYWDTMMKADRANLPFRFINCVHRDDPITSRQSYCRELVDYFYKD